MKDRTKSPITHTHPSSPFIYQQPMLPEEAFDLTIAPRVETIFEQTTTATTASNNGKLIKIRVVFPSPKRHLDTYDIILKCFGYWAWIVLVSILSGLIFLLFNT